MKQVIIILLELKRYALVAFVMLVLLMILIVNSAVVGVMLFATDTLVNTDWLSPVNSLVGGIILTTYKLL